MIDRCAAADEQRMCAMRAMSVRMRNAGMRRSDEYDDGDRKMRGSVQSVHSCELAIETPVAAGPKFQRERFCPLIAQPRAHFALSMLALIFLDASHQTLL
jgi:hypothetical protein